MDRTYSLVLGCLCGYCLRNLISLLRRIPPNLYRPTRLVSRNHWTLIYGNRGWHDASDCNRTPGSEACELSQERSEHGARTPRGFSLHCLHCIHSLSHWTTLVLMDFGPHHHSLDLADPCGDSIWRRQLFGFHIRIELYCGLLRSLFSLCTRWE